MDDYLELPLYLDGDDPNEAGVTLLVYLKDKSLLVFPEVKTNPIRYQGWWSIRYTLMDSRATAKIPSEDVRYFSVNEPDTTTTTMS